MLTNIIGIFLNQLIKFNINSKSDNLTASKLPILQLNTAKYDGVLTVKEVLTIFEDASKNKIYHKNKRPKEKTKDQIETDCE